MMRAMRAVERARERAGGPEGAPVLRSGEEPEEGELGEHSPEGLRCCILRNI